MQTPKGIQTITRSDHVVEQGALVRWDLLSQVAEPALQQREKGISNRKKHRCQCVTSVGIGLVNLVQKHTFALNMNPPGTLLESQACSPCADNLRSIDVSKPYCRRTQQKAPDLQHEKTSNYIFSPHSYAASSSPNQNAHAPCSSAHVNKFASPLGFGAGWFRKNASSPAVT